MNLKPQDIVVLLRIFLYKERSWSIRMISNSIVISNSEVHMAIKRCKDSGLIEPVSGKVSSSAMAEFLIHGLKYAFPAEIGPPSRGVPTAHSAKPISDIIRSEEIYVWPYSKGEIKGVSILPLYKTVPIAALKDSGMYEFLALIDSLRIGRVREVKIAQEQLLQRINK